MKQQQDLYRGILPLLVKMEAIYQTGQSPQELDVVARLFAEALDGENIGDIERAFKMHIAQSKRFPTPAHILELLPECRVSEKRTALPEKPQGKRTPGLGEMVCKAVRGDISARAIVDKFFGQMPKLAITDGKSS